MVVGTRSRRCLAAMCTESKDGARETEMYCCCSSESRTSDAAEGARYHTDVVVFPRCKVCGYV